MIILEGKKLSAALHLDSAEEVLREIPENSVDLIITSPPYFVGKEYDTSKSWDDFRMEIARTAPFMVKSLKQGGSLCWQVGNHVQNGELTPLDALLTVDMKSFPELTLRNRIIWTFGHGTHSSKKFSGRHETILWYTKGDNYHFNLDVFRVPQKYPGKRHYKGPNKGKLSGNPLGKNPGDLWDLGAIWDIPNVKAKHIEKTGHPCQFPTALVRRLISGLVPDNGVVMDPYMGSGSAGVAALIENKNFIGSDISEFYYEIAQKRIQSTIDDTIKVREDKPIREPKPNEKVAQRPAHFI